MGVKLMTGATGEQNIQAADDRECLAGITGLDSYVFPTGSQLKATLVNANTVTIGTGAGSLQGSRFRCSTTTAVNIQSGTQGQYRRDIIGLRFSRETNGREGLEFQVLTGKPAASEGAAADPAYTVGNLLKGDAKAFMPLYRIKLSGINAADPEPMFSVLTPLATIRDSISRHRFRLDSSCTCYIEGGICIVSVDYLNVPVANSSYRVGTLPNGIKPLGQTVSEQTGNNDVAYIAPLRWRGDDSKYGQIMVLNSGEIATYASTTGTYYYGQLIFPVTRS